MSYQDVRSFYEDPPDSEDLRRAHTQKCPSCAGSGRHAACEGHGDIDLGTGGESPFRRCTCDDGKCPDCGGAGEATDEQIRQMAEDEDRAATLEANIAAAEAAYAEYERTRTDHEEP